MKPTYITLSFQGWKIRGLQHNGIVKWVSLRDICAILNKIFNVRYGKEIATLCPNRQMMHTDANTSRSWVISPSEIPPLCLELSGKTAHSSPVIKELIKWSEEIEINKTIDMSGIPDTVNKAVKEYIYNDIYTVSFQVKDGKVMINATQMAKAFGKQPTIWLRLSSTHQFREKLVHLGESSDLDSQVIASRGSQGGTWMEKELALEYAKWLSAEFYEWCYEKASEMSFPPLVPSQLTRGSKMVSRTENFPVPKNYEEALLLAARQARELRENEFKINYYDTLVENRDWFSTTRIADELQVPAYQVNAFLHELGIVHYYPSKKEWMTTAEYDSLQCDVPYYWTNKYGKSYRYGSHRRWSRTGREFIIELWKQHHKP